MSETTELRIQTLKTFEKLSLDKKIVIYASIIHLESIVDNLNLNNLQLNIYNKVILGLKEKLMKLNLKSWK